MRTYFCECPTPDAVYELRHPSWKVAFKWRRAVVLASNPKFTPPINYIVKVADCDLFAEACKEWLTRSIVDDLHEEYKLQSPVPRRKVDAAVEKWRAAREAVRRNKAEAMKLETQLRKAAADLVRVHGSGPIQVDGVVYHVSYAEDSKTNHRCQGTQGTFVHWQETHRSNGKARH